MLEPEPIGRLRLCYYAHWIWCGSPSIRIRHREEENHVPRLWAENHLGSANARGGRQDGIR
jgi:hypothetical protein